MLALAIPDLPLQRRRRGREGSDRPAAIVDEGRVACADAAAQAAGVRPGMTAAAALAACGPLELVPADAAADAAALRALAEAMLALAPAVELAPPDALLLDAGAAHLAAGARAAAGAVPDARRDADERALAARAAALAAELGWEVRAAVADGRGPARALARHGGAALVRVPPGGEAAALAPLPVAALGVAPEVVRRLAALGVRDAAALARLPREALVHRFGADGAGAARLARGEDPSPLAPWTPEALPEEAIELEAPAESAEPLVFVLKRLADRVAARLAGRGLGATRLVLALRLDPRGDERVVVTLAQPTASAARWLAPAKEHLFALRLPAPVAGLRLAAAEVAPVAPEQLAIGDRPEAADALDAVLARLSVRLGAGALFAAEPVERYRPEAAYRSVPFRPRARRAAGEDAGDPDAPAGDRGGRSRRRRARGAGDRGAARTAAAVAPAAEDPSRFRPTRLVSPPRPAVAEGEGGRVTAVRVGGEAHAVLALEGPERIAGEWWAEPLDREYWRVRLAGLGDCWLYRDGGGRLWLHGYFD